MVTPSYTLSSLLRFTFWCAFFVAIFRIILYADPIFLVMATPQLGLCLFAPDMFLGRRTISRLAYWIPLFLLATVAFSYSASGLCGFDRSIQLILCAQGMLLITVAIQYWDSVPTGSSESVRPIFRARFSWAAFVSSVLCLIPATQWPLHLSFAIYEQRLQKFVTERADDTSVSQIGPFRFESTSFDSEMIVLSTRNEYGGGLHLVYTNRHRRVLNEDLCIQLSNVWYFVDED